MVVASAATLLLDVTIAAYTLWPRPAWSPSELAIFRSLSIDSLGPIPANPANAVADDPRAAALGRALFSKRGSARMARCRAARATSPIAISRTDCRSHPAWAQQIIRQCHCPARVHRVRCSGTVAKIASAAGSRATRERGGARWLTQSTPAWWRVSTPDDYENLCGPLPECGVFRWVAGPVADPSAPRSPKRIAMPFHACT